MKNAFLPATLALLLAVSAGGETLDITAAALGINSARVPSVSILTADVATVTGGKYTSTADGTTSILDITGGTWSSYDPNGTSSTMIFGPVAVEDRAAVSPVTFRISGKDTTIVSQGIKANRGTMRFELSDGATLVNTNANCTFARDNGKDMNGNVTIVMNDSTFRSYCGSGNANVFLGGSGWDSVYGTFKGDCSLYATNSTFYSSYRASFNRGDFVFSACKFIIDLWDESALSFGSARCRLDNNTTCSAIVRLGGDSSFTIDGATVESAKFFAGTANSTSTAILRLLDGSLTCSQHLTPCVDTQPTWVDLQGGILSVRTMCGQKTHAKNPTANGYARLTGNGATILGFYNTDSSTKFLIQNWDLIEIGAKGLTIDNNGYLLTISNDFVNVEGEEGWLRKTGSGTLDWKTPAAYSVSRTIVDRDTFLLNSYTADASVTFATALLVTNGATFSIVGNVKDLTLGSLAITNAVLKMDPTDAITVTGAASVEGLVLSLSSTPAVDTTNRLLTVRGAMSADTATALAKAIAASATADGTYGEVTAKTTADGTVFTLVTKSNAPIGGSTSWKGPGAAWAEDANWSDKVPVATNTASFADATAPSEVTVASAADVGALAFSAGNFKLTGAGSLNFGAPGSSSVTVSSGAHTVDVAVVQQAVAPVDLTSDTSLLFAKSVTGGGISKTGKGHLTLAGANDFSGRITIGGGLLTAENAAALAGSATIALGEATLETTESMTLPASTALTPSASATTKAVVIKNEEDLTVSSVVMDTGCFIKRGLGTLTFDARTGLCSQLAKNTGTTSGSVVFADDGTPPTGGFGGFTILEGEVVVKGNGATPVAFSGPVYIGMSSKTGRSSPCLTLDGVKATIDTLTDVGHASWNASEVARNTVLRIINGATLTTYNTSQSDQYTATSRSPTIAVTNATLTVSGANQNLSYSTIRQGKGRGALLAHNAKLNAPNHRVAGNTQSRLSASVVAGSDGVSYANFESDRNCKGEVLFDEGTLLKINAFSMTDYMQEYGGLFVFAFDDATWDVGPDNLTINSSNMNQGTAEYPKPKKFEVRAGGLTIQVASGKTLQTAAEFRGYGPLTLTGGGTLKFDDGAFTITGAVAVASGTVDFSSVTAVSNNVIRGAGTVSGAAFKEGIVLDPQIASDWTVGAAPTFADCAFASGVTVDCSAASAAGRPTSEVSVVIARYTGTAPDVSTWQLAGTGVKRLRATLTAADGEIRLKIPPRKGVVLFVR